MLFDRRNAMMAAAAGLIGWFTRGKAKPATAESDIAGCDCGEAEPTSWSVEISGCPELPKAFTVGAEWDCSMPYRVFIPEYQSRRLFVQLEDGRRAIVCPREWAVIAIDCECPETEGPS